MKDLPVKLSSCVTLSISRILAEELSESSGSTKNLSVPVYLEMNEMVFTLNVQWNNQLTQLSFTTYLYNPYIIRIRFQNEAKR